MRRELFFVGWKWTWLLIGGICLWLTGSALAVLVTHDPLWIDELHTAWVIAGEPAELPARAAAGNQTPLYFAAVRAGAPLVADPDWGLRGLSLAAVLATGLMILAALAQWTRCWSVGVAAAVLYWGQDSSLFFGSEARPYAVLQFLVLGCWVWGARQLSGKVRLSWIGKLIQGLSAAVAALAVVGVHPTGGVILVMSALSGLVVVALTRSESGAAKLSGGDLASLGGRLIGLVIAGVWILVNLAETGRNHHLWEAIVDPPNTLLTIAWPLVSGFLGVAGLSLLAVVGRAGTWSAPRDAVGDRDWPGVIEWRRWWWLTLTIAGTTLGLWLAYRCGGWPLMHPRYVAGLTPLLVVWCGLTWARVTPSALRSAGLLLIVMVGLLCPAPLVSSEGWHWSRSASWLVDCVRGRGVPQLRQENWRVAWQILGEEHRGEQPIFLFSNLLEDSRIDPFARPAERDDDYFLFPAIDAARALRVHIRPRPTWQTPRFSSNDCQTATAAQGAWWVVRTDQVALVESLWAEWNTATAGEEWQVERVAQVTGNVQVFRLWSKSP